MRSFFVKLFSLILPAIFPSWRFFEEVGPAPVLEVFEGGEWHQARPAAPRLGVMAMIRCLLWNPHWNETLYLNSCAERLIVEPTAHAKAVLDQHFGDQRYRIYLRAREGAGLALVAAFDSETGHLEP